MNKPEIKALTGLRGIAAVWIALFHFGALMYMFLPELGRAYSIINEGYLGVELFFMLSGFILSYVYEKSFFKFDWKTYGKFLRNRLARLYPVHIFALALVALSYGVFHWLGRPYGYTFFGKLDLFLNLILVHAWGFSDRSWNVVSWAISVFWLGFLLFPIFFKLASKSKAAAINWVGYIGCMIVLVLFFHSIPLSIATFHGGVFRMFLEMLAGCFLFSIFKTLPANRLFFSFLFWISIAGVLALCFLHVASPWAAPLLGITILSAAMAKGWAVRILEFRLFIFLGKISYSLYLTHHLLIYLIRQVFPPESFSSSTLFIRSLIVCLYFLIMFAFASATYYGVENPLRFVLKSKTA